MWGQIHNVCYDENVLGGGGGGQKASNKNSTYHKY